MIIQSKKVWIGNVFIPAQIEIDGEKIAAVRDYGSVDPDFDFGEERIVPGFIDVHTHGAYGYEANDDFPEGLRTWTEMLPCEGVTAFQPTTITQSREVLLKAVRNVADVVEEGYKGAEILGIHFEGPYLDQQYKGAQPEQYIIDADVEQFKEYQRAANGLIHYITLAPEHDKDYELTKYCTQTGVRVSLGHSGADYKTAVLAVGNGAVSFTHVYNGMSPFRHRELGMVGTALRLDNVYGEVIADGLHSDVQALHNFYMAKGPHHAIMISDSLSPKGLPQGDYTSGGMKIRVYPDGSAHLVPQGNLAGSTLMINRGIKIAVEEAQVPFEHVINSCTLNPARMLGIDDRKGRIVSGFDADIVVLDQNYNVIQTFVKGKAWI